MSGLSGPTTLAEAGFFYNPGSSNDVFGNPAPFATRDQAQSQFPRGNDDSSHPQFSQARHQRDIVQGSSTTNSGKENYNDHRSMLEKVRRQNAPQILLFAAAMGLALWL